MDMEATVGSKNLHCSRDDPPHYVRPTLRSRQPGSDPALHPAAIAIYLDAVEQLAKALSASNAKAACLELRELVDCIIVAPRVKPGDPIHYEVRRRLTALMQPTRAECRQERWCPGREPYATTDTTNRCLSLVWWRECLARWRRFATS